MTEVYTARLLLESSYIGDAKEEISQYINSLYVHIQKMMTLYGSLLTYIYGAYEKLEATDEALSQWILNNWGVEVEVKDEQINSVFSFGILKESGIVTVGEDVIIK